MINKYIKVEQGSYRNQDMSGRIFPILKDYQRFAGKEGGFITVDCSELDGFEALDKARINVPAITDLTLTTEGAFQIQRDELKTDSTDAPVNTGEETDEQAIDRIAARFEILDEMAEAVSTSKVRAMIVSGPPGIGKSYGVERALEKRSMFDDIANQASKFEVVKGAMSPIGLYKKLYEHSAKGHVVCFDDCDAILYDDLALNLLKAALDTGKKRTLHWNTESRTLMAEGMPNSVRVQRRGGVHNKCEVRQRQEQEVAGPFGGPTEQMPLPGPNHRLHEGSYAPYQTDSWHGYVGEVRHGQGSGSRVGAVHIR